MGPGGREIRVCVGRIRPRVTPGVELSFMFDIDYRVVLYIALALACLGTLVLSEDKIRNGFLFFLCTLGLGWRTFHVTTALRIHPAEVVLCVLFACCLGQRQPTRSSRANGWLPAWLWI